MLDRLRLPFFIIAMILIIAVLVEMGSSAILPKPKTDHVLRAAVESELKTNKDLDRGEVEQQLINDSSNAEKPPGIAISYMALLDGLVAFDLYFDGRILDRAGTPAWEGSGPHNTDHIYTCHHRRIRHDDRRVREDTGHDCALHSGADSVHWPTSRCGAFSIRGGAAVLLSVLCC